MIRKTIILTEENHRFILKYMGKLLLEGKEVNYSQVVNMIIEQFRKRGEEDEDGK